MARIRTIKPEFWTDDAITECSLSARLLFIGMWNFADDRGNIERSAKQMKMKIFPADTVDVESLLLELMHNNLIIEYEFDGKKYLHIRTFADHQVINRPSKTGLPEYDESLRTHATLTDDSLTEGKGKEGKGKEEEIKTLSGKPDPIPYQTILDDMNATLDRQFHLTGDFKKLVKARWSEGFREPDFHTVCEKMQIKWGRDPTMAPYLRPATLFQASKFDGYLNTEITLSDKGVVSTTTQRNMDVFERFAREVENA